MIQDFCGYCGGFLDNTIPNCWPSAVSTTTICAGTSSGAAPPPSVAPKRRPAQPPSWPGKGDDRARETT